MAQARGHCTRSEVFGEGAEVLAHGQTRVARVLPLKVPPLQPRLSLLSSLCSQIEMALEPASGRQQRRKRKWLWALAVLFVGGLMIFFWNSDLALFPHKHTSTVLVLEDCDDDFKTPPFEDAVIAFGPNGKSSRLITDLNTCQTIGGSRCLSVSPDGRFFVVCEIVGKHLKAYETQTGKPLWSVDGEFTAATVARDGRVFAVISDGKIYGEKTVVIDQTGHITKTAGTAGFDMALDEKREVLWLIGKTIKKCDLALNVFWEIKPIGWCASSVDVNSDGSVWVAERDHPNVSSSTNRLLRVDLNGQITKTLNLAWSPGCVRVDHSDESFWVTGFDVTKSASWRALDSIERKTGHLPIGKKARDFLTKYHVSPETDKFDKNGSVVRRISEAGHTLEIDPSDQSMWLAAQNKLFHYSRDGKKIGVLGGVSSEQKYIAVIPEKMDAKTSTNPPRTP
jgi:DNA-binding beta-propeller fold protein YncE